MRTISRRRFTSLVALAIAPVFALTPAPPARAQVGERERTIYVSAVDKDGEPVLDMGVNDFAVREDGLAREVLRVSRAVEPIDIAILVDNSEASDGVMPRMREALEAFVTAMTPTHAIAIVGLADRPTILADYTRNTTLLRDAIGRLWPMSQSGSTLLDAVLEVARGLSRREGPRMVILPLITDGGDYSHASYEQVRDVLTNSGASLHSIGVGAFALTDDDELRNRERLLADGARRSGGQRVVLFAATAVEQALARLGRELSSQYKVVYGRPESLVPPENLDVLSRRPGVTVRAAPARGQSGA